MFLAPADGRGVKANYILAAGAAAAVTGVSEKCLRPEALERQQAFGLVAHAQAADRTCRFRKPPDRRCDESPGSGHAVASCRLSLPCIGTDHDWRQGRGGSELMLDRAPATLPAGFRRRGAPGMTPSGLHRLSAINVTGPHRVGRCGKVRRRRLRVRAMRRSQPLSVPGPCARRRSRPWTAAAWPGTGQ